MALRANSWVERTASGERAWRSDDSLPLAERRLLGACQLAVTVKDLYQRSGDPLAFETMVNGLIRKGYLALHDEGLRPERDTAPDAVEIADPQAPRQSSALRDMLGRLQRSNSTGRTASATSAPTDEAVSPAPDRSAFSLWGGRRDGKKSQGIAEDYDDFAQQLMMHEEEAEAPVVPLPPARIPRDSPVALPSWEEPETDPDAIDSRLLRLGEAIDRETMDPPRSPEMPAPPSDQSPVMPGAAGIGAHGISPDEAVEEVSYISPDALWGDDDEDEDPVAFVRRPTPLPPVVPVSQSFPAPAPKESPLPQVEVNHGAPHQGHTHQGHTHQGHTGEDEGDFEDDNTDWLSQQPAKSFVGATSDVRPVSSNPRLGRLSQTLDRMGGLNAERAAALARGEAYKEKLRLEAEAALEKKKGNVDVRRRVAESNARQEATSFSSMADRLKNLKKPRHPDE
jgi:hypothetical protein